MALTGRFLLALSRRCGALRTQMAFSGHYADFGALRTVRCNGAFFRFFNYCPFFDTAEKVHTTFYIFWVFLSLDRCSSI